MKKFFFLLLLLILFNSVELAAQSRKIQRLEKRLENAEGKKRIEYLAELAELYVEGEPDKAIDYIDEALKLTKKNDIPDKLHAQLYNTLGGAYFYKEKYRRSIKAYEDELELLRKSGQKKSEIKTLFNIATLYKKRGWVRKSEDAYKESLAAAQKNNYRDLIMVNYKALYELYEEWGKYKEALQYFDLYVSTRHSQLARKNRRRISILSSKYKFEKKLKEETEQELVETEEELIKTIEREELLRMEKANIEKEKELVNYEKKLRERELKVERDKVALREKLIYAGMIVLIIFLALTFLLFRQFSLTKKANKKLEKQKRELLSQSYQLENAFDELERKNQEIIDSINYAKRIQEAILIPEHEIRKHLPEAFIYYQPKDIVSGDFYWFSRVERKLVIAAIDCTGHGVPGAFMSMIGNTLLNEIVNQKRITKPDIILTELHLGVLTALQQNRRDSDSEDGMDMSLCTIDLHNRRFQFAGAKNNLYVVQNKKLKVLKANFHSIGGRPLREGMKVEFTSYDFLYDQNTSIYMLSDGYVDQFGGEDNTKFNSPRFKEMLVQNVGLTMQQQKKMIQKTFVEWKGDNRQIDDILVMGVRLS